MIQLQCCCTGFAASAAFGRTLCRTTQLHIKLPLQLPGPMLNEPNFHKFQKSQHLLFQPPDTMAPLSEVVKMLKGQAFGKLTVPDMDLTGKTVVVTGANTGLGFECVKHL
jgi:hypothetical protein